jgi:hypothetical protein
MTPYEKIVKLAMQWFRGIITEQEFLQKMWEVLNDDDYTSKDV